MTFSTLYDLVQGAKRQKPLGKSGWGFVVRFPGHESECYVIKADSRFPLNMTTALTPVDYGLRSNFGQPVMLDSECAESETGLIKLGILSRVPGRDLIEVELRLRERVALRPNPCDISAEARALLFEELARLPDFTFERWMQGKRYQLEKGVGGDTSFGNMMYDRNTKSVRDIDVIQHGNKDWCYNNAENIVKRLLLIPYSFPDAGELYTRQSVAAEIIKEKVLKAARVAGVPADRNYFADKIPPSFTRTNLTTQLGQVMLSDRPEKLSALLKEMESRQYITLG